MTFKQDFREALDAVEKLVNSGDRATLQQSEDGASWYMYLTFVFLSRDLPNEQHILLGKVLYDATDDTLDTLQNIGKLLDYVAEL